MPVQNAARLFGGNCAQLVGALTERLEQTRCSQEFNDLSAPELNAMIERILGHCSGWAAGEERELPACVDFLENMCFAMAIPLSEAAYMLYVLRQGISDLHVCEKELERRETMAQVNKFFEALLHDLLGRY